MADVSSARDRGHEGCPDVIRDVIRDLSAESGVEITVSTARPLIRTPYTADPFICPHGVAHWVEPTSEQIAAWARDGVR